MKKAGMATHALSTINEGKAIRILSDFLESENSIKTFFKENDRTPNYDGTFEIINDDATPKKQFIVQIKKVENLTPNVKGANKGKYVYSLETQFLYYVKEKVTESPAIYFVVDISNNNIFWIYLSDSFGGFVVCKRKNALKTTQNSGFRAKTRHFPYIKQLFQFLFE